VKVVVVVPELEVINPAPMSGCSDPGMRKPKVTNFSPEGPAGNDFGFSGAGKLLAVDESGVPCGAVVLGGGVLCVPGGACASSRKGSTKIVTDVNRARSAHELAGIMELHQSWSM
jgi:hypothetical protein